MIPRPSHIGGSHDISVVNDAISGRQKRGSPISGLKETVTVLNRRDTKKIRDRLGGVGERGADPEVPSRPGHLKSQQGDMLPGMVTPRESRVAPVRGTQLCSELGGKGAGFSQNVATGF